MFSNIIWLYVLCAQLDWGPITVRSHAPIFHNRLSYTPGRILPLQQDVAEINIGLSHANLWAQMPGYFFDGEWSRLALRAGMGLGAFTEIDIEFTAYRRSGGFLDTTIEGFHNLFHVTQARRLQYPKNRLYVATIDNNGTTIQLDHRNIGYGIGNPTLGVKTRLLCQSTPQTCSYPAVVLEFVIKLPLGHISQQFATDNLAGLLDISLQIPLGKRWQIYTASGMIVSPKMQRVYGMQLADVQKFLLAALEYRLGDSATAVFHYLNQDGIVELATYAPLNMTTHEFVLGIKWAPMHSDRLIVEFGIIENSVHDANTPDFGLQTALQWRFHT